MLCLVQHSKLCQTFCSKLSFRRESKLTVIPPCLHLYFRAHTDSINDITYINQEKLLLTGCVDGSVRLWTTGGFFIGEACLADISDKIFVLCKRECFIALQKSPGTHSSRFCWTMGKKEIVVVAMCNIIWNVHCHCIPRRKMSQDDTDG